METNISGRNRINVRANSTELLYLSLEENGFACLGSSSVKMSVKAYSKRKEFSLQTCSPFSGKNTPFQKGFAVQKIISAASFDIKTAKIHQVRPFLLTFMFLINLSSSTQPHYTFGKGAIVGNQCSKIGRCTDIFRDPDMRRRTEPLQRDMHCTGQVRCKGTFGMGILF